MNKDGLIRYLNYKYENAYKNFLQGSSFYYDVIYIEINAFPIHIREMIYKKKETMLSYFYEWIINDNNLFIEEEIKKYKFKFIYQQKVL